MCRQSQGEMPCKSNFIAFFWVHYHPYWRVEGDDIEDPWKRMENAEKEERENTKEKVSFFLPAQLPPFAKATNLWICCCPVKKVVKRARKKATFLLSLSPFSFLHIGTHKASRRRKRQRKAQNNKHPFLLGLAFVVCKFLPQICLLSSEHIGVKFLVRKRIWKHSLVRILVAVANIQSKTKQRLCSKREGTWKKEKNVDLGIGRKKTRRKFAFFPKSAFPFFFRSLSFNTNRKILSLVEDWSVEQVSAKTAIGRRLVGFEPKWQRHSEMKSCSQKENQCLKNVNAKGEHSFGIMCWGRRKQMRPFPSSSHFGF